MNRTALCFAAVLCATGLRAAPASPASPPAAEAVKLLDAEFEILPAEFGPDSTLTLTFPTAMVPADRVGTKEEKSPLLTSPVLAGEFEWTSTRSGIYRLKEAPKFSASYRFDLRAGLKDLQGTGIAAKKLRDTSTERFRITDQYPKWWSHDDVSRTPQFLFEFNDNVKPEAAAAGMAFKCADTSARVAVKVRHATGADFKAEYADPSPTWAERVTHTVVKLADADVRRNALIITPAEPLPAGQKWVLDIASTIQNEAGSSTLNVGDAVRVGAVKEFRVTKMQPHVWFDRPKFVDLHFTREIVAANADAAVFNKQSQAAAAALLQKLRVEPAVGDLKAQAFSDMLRISSADFKLGTTYTVTLSAEGTQSADGMGLAVEATGVAVFVTNPPYLAVPAFINAQLSSGKGEFEFAAANVTQVRVRAKRLNGPQLLQAIDLIRPYVNLKDSSQEQRAKFKPAAYEEYPGTQVYERSFPISKKLDESELQRLRWQEILGAAAPTGPLYVELEGTAMQGTNAKNVIAQTVVQFTDIGVFHKDDRGSSTVYAVSLKTGKPMAKVKVTLVDEEHKLLGYADTNALGLATISSKSPAYILAQLGEDCTALQVQDYETMMPLWNFNVPTAWENPWTPRQTTYLFSDRGVYKPGEVAHLKAYTRQLSGDKLTLRPDLPAKLILRDPRYRVVLSKDISFTAAGSWSGDVTLPTNQVGSFSAKIEFTSQAGEDGEECEDSGGFASFSVADYKPNSFELKMDEAQMEVTADKVKLPLSANYYMGKSLTKAEVQWNAYRLEGEELFPELWEYHFGDAPRWARYGTDADPDDEEGAEEGRHWDASGDGSLNADGKYSIEMPRATGALAQLPMRIEFSAEVTDINEQTIVLNRTLTLPGTAPQVIGIKGPSSFGRVGQEMTLQAIVVDKDGRQTGPALPADIVIEHQSYQTLTVEAAGGGQTHKNQAVLTQVLKQDLTLNPKGTDIPFTPEKSGTYFITATSQAGAMSRRVFYVIGGKEFPWATEDGTQMDLLADKKIYKPGEEALLVVKTPFTANALVTVERNQVYRSYQVEVSPESPTIRVPITDADAPVVYVSVLLVRGSDAATKADKLPEYRLGYCTLKVESQAEKLSLAVKPSKDSVRPGEELTVTTTLTGADGNAVPQAELTLYAVDEGVLSLTGYETPDPLAWFHAPAPLAIKNRTNFFGLLTEDQATRTRGNKGIVIGGGGDEEAIDLQTRKKFIATPLWIGSVLTDAKGSATTTFTAPDSLTRYRIMAVASEGARRFGSAASQMIVNKPLMVEPVVPRFARLGDEFLIKALVHNTTQATGTVSVTLTLDSGADYITEQRPFILTSTGGASSPQGKSWTRTLQLAAGESSTVIYPVKASALGDTTWQWSAKTTQWSDATAQADAVESTLKVEHPMPKLRDVRYLSVSAAAPVENALAGVDPKVLEGEGGTLSIHLAGSRLPELTDALDYLLQYPYGCVEQTSSAAMPWLALGGMQETFPQIQPEQSKKAIQAAVNRLLAMVTDRGGLSYWPGGQDPNLWGSAYGGWVLLKAKDMGADVPQEVVDELLAFLSGELRQLEDEQDEYVLCDSAFALYTLAKGGRAEPAYQNTLYARRDKLPRLAKAFLALAMLVSGAPEVQATTLLGTLPPPTPVVVKPAVPATAASKAKSSTKGKATKGKATTKGKTKPKAATPPAPPPPPAWEHWVGSQVNYALRLLGYTHLGMKAEAQDALTNLLNSRTADGGWRNTFTNAWALTALAAHQRSQKATFVPTQLAANWGDKSLKLDLPSLMVPARGGFPLDAALTATPLKLSLATGGTAYARVETQSWSKLREFGGENRGYGISRQYEKLLPDGSHAAAKDLRVGDMLLVTLTVSTPGGGRYIAIDDPLPAVLETVKPEFTTAASKKAEGEANDEAWFCDHREMRTDRTVFFTDNPPGKGTFRLRYLARVVAEGDVIVPSARIEAMYEPSKSGLSATQRLVTLPQQANVAAK